VRSEAGAGAMLALIAEGPPSVRYAREIKMVRWRSPGGQEREERLAFAIPLGLLAGAVSGFGRAGLVLAVAALRRRSRCELR